MKRILSVLLILAITFSMSLAMSSCVEAVLYSFEAEDDLSILFTSDDEFYCYGDRSLFSDGESHKPYKLTDPKVALDVAITDTTAVFLTSDGLMATGVPADLPFGDVSTVAITEPVRFVYDETTAKLDPSARYVSADLSDAKQVVSGRDFTLVLKNDGTIYGWGSNAQGQLLADESIMHTNTPLRVGSLEGISQIACSYGDLCAAIDMDGHVWVWGSDVEPRTGGAPFRIPDLEQAVEVVCIGGSGELFNIDGVSVGAYGQVFILDANAKVWDFGLDTSGLPYGFGQVSDLPEIYSLVAGSSFCAAKDGEGNVWTWGDATAAYYGQLGREVDLDSFGDDVSARIKATWTPAKVEGLTGVISLSAGRNHVMAMTQNMTVYAWGDNSHGQLGLDPAETPYSAAPVQAPKINMNVSRA